MKHSKKTPFECIALLLQGGGALGAYQAGVYQALSEAGLEPNWVAGVSIGAINAAIIAGNAPEERVSKLRAFWEGVTPDNFGYVPEVFKSLLTRNNSEHQFFNLMSAFRTISLGIPSFFKPRPLIPWLAPQGTTKATSFDDTSPLKATLENLIDFDRINKAEIRFNIGAANVMSGNFVNFDNATHKITAEHVMASGALPPGFPAIKIDKDYYWDGGLISNTPLQWLLDSTVYLDTIVFQVDLWSADGNFPKNMAEILTREKDIRYSSRTRASTDHFAERHKLRLALFELFEELPEKFLHSTKAKFLKEHAYNKIYNIVHLIYHNKAYEGYSKDIEFSRLSMEAHWKAGYEDTLKTLKHPEVLQRPHNKDGIAIFDFSKDKS